MSEIDFSTLATKLTICRLLPAGTQHLQAITHLGRRPTTTFKEPNQQLKTLNGPALLENPEKEGKVERFKVINKLSIFIICQACKCKINEISQQKSLKCKKCGDRQRKRWNVNEMHLFNCLYN